MRKNCKCYLFYVNFGATTFYHELTPEEARQKMHEYARDMRRGLRHATFINQNH